MKALPLALLACLAGTLPGQDPDTHLRIGTWNLEQLGFREPRRSAADLAALTEFVRGLNVDVLAVQEVGGAEPMRALCAGLGADWDFVLGSTGTFSDATGQIAIGFLWNRARVSMLDAEEFLDLPRRRDDLPIFHRVPVSAVFRSRNGGFDFRAVVVHFKAGRGTKNEAKRCLETDLLRQHIEGLLAREGEDRDVLVLGDFNHTRDTEEQRRLTHGGVFRYLQDPDASATIIHFDGAIDHIAIGADLVEEAVGTPEVHDTIANRDRQAWRETFSDHFPLTLAFDASRDRDPEATFRPAPQAWRLLPGGIAMAALRPQDPNRVETRTGAAATRPADDDLPLTRGDIVTVYYTGGGRVSGVLLTPPGEWVVLRSDQGRRYSLPREAVTLIREGR